MVKKPTKLHDRPKAFQLLRTKDSSGISGTGYVAEGVVLHDGRVILSWFGKFHTIEILGSIEEVIQLHGHGGNSEVVWEE